MWHLYLDESGDLGFDFVNKKPSKFFTITILAISDDNRNKAIINATKKTIRKKLNPKNQNKIHELKGTTTTLEIKKYFYSQVKEIKFGIYSITLNKKRLYQKLTKNKERVYNFIARQVIDKIPFEKCNENAIDLIVDKSKGKPEIIEFNNYIKNQLEAKIKLNIPINIRHCRSHENHGLQACDLFCYGIFINYERKKCEWRDVFLDKILNDETYLE
ncbi:MAG: DUF3800 domain-containing protein [Rickettsiales bacterium]|nr:DUF3800 domain-containing protein [Rickettsiales bacterium]